LCDNYEEYNFSFSSLAISNPFEFRETIEDDYESKIEMNPSMQDNPDNQVLCASALHLIKTTEIYLMLMSCMTPISFDIFIGITNLVEYYIYAIYTKFVQDDS